MEPTTVLPIISLLSLVSVEYGGWALLGFLTGRGQLGEFRERFPALGTPTPGCYLYSRSSTSSTSTAADTRTGFSGWWACSCSWASSPNQEASSSTLLAGRRTAAL